jgi:hypothetical protein
MTLQKRLRSIDSSLSGEERLAKKRAIISQWLNDSDASDDNSDESDDDSSVCSWGSDDTTNYIMSLPRELRNDIYDHVWGSQPCWKVYHERMIFVVYYGGTPEERRARQSPEFRDISYAQLATVQRLGWLDTKWMVACKTVLQEAKHQFYTYATWNYMRHSRWTKMHLKPVQPATPNLFPDPACARVLNFVLNDPLETMAEYTESCLALSKFAESRLSRVSKVLSFGDSLRSLELEMPCTTDDDPPKYGSVAGSVSISTLESFASYSQLDNLKLLIWGRYEEDNISNIKTLFEEGVMAMARKMVTGPAELSSEIVDHEDYDKCWVLYIKRK